MTLHVGNLRVEEAVSIIQHALQQPCFQSTPGSRRLLRDRALSARVEAVLVGDFPRVSADAVDGEVLVHVRGSRADEENLTTRVERLVQELDGVKTLRVNIVPFMVED
jgi:hypothetical protein